MIKLTNIYENIVTDLKNENIIITKNVLAKISTDIDIQNAHVKKIVANKLSDIKGRYIFVVGMEEVVSAIYNKSKFDYNPNKIKVSDLLTDEYHCYEVVDNKGSILSKQKERRDARAGLVKTSELDIPKRSTQRMYSMEKDWNPEINREYYKKILLQNNLSKYALKLDNAYDVVQNLIEHRRLEKTIGKRTVYNDWISKITNKIQKIELILDNIHKDTGYEADKLDKEMKSLITMCKTAFSLISTEDDSIKRFGYEPAQPARMPIR